ncbi:MAG: carbon-nitrogen hydrolase family protein [Bacillota bacterium]|nr:carbon-nitrogen hydrolase family protein [Bacillota bacterium]
MKEKKEVKTALIHAAIAWKDKEYNLRNLLALNEEAARQGAKIIVSPELALSGYSFYSRSEIAFLAETIPGPATERFSEVARRHQVYLALGLPECDQKTGLLYNSAVFIGPGGEVLGRARKLAPAFKENLWSARGNLPVLVCETAYGRVGLIICADAYWYKPARLAALKGARLLLVLANWPPQCHPPENFWRARALENGFYLLACNRTGTDRSMDCTQARSYLIDSAGSIVQEFQAAEDAIFYADIPLEGEKFPSAPVQERLAARRPELYQDIALDAFSHFEPEMLLGLPAPGPFVTAAVQFRPLPLRLAENRQMMASLLDRACVMAEERKLKLDLAVLPELATTGVLAARAEALQGAEAIPGPTVDLLARKAWEKRLYVVWGMAERDGESLFNTAVLVGPAGLLGKYRKVHPSPLDAGWARAGENEFVSFDLPCARVGLLLGSDLLFPESAESLAKRGVDLLCVPAFWTEKEILFLWEARAVEQQVHLVVANQWGGEGSCGAGGSFIFSYARHPEKRQKIAAPGAGDEIRVLLLNPLSTRQKRFLEAVDYEPLLSKNDRAFKKWK